MTVPILTFYLIGLIFFILGLEADDKNRFAYLGMAFVTNLMAYLLSYSDVDFLSASYLPLILMIISVLSLIYNAWNKLPGMEWDESDNQEERA